MKRAGLTVVGALILLTALSSLAWAAEKCGGADIANGPFTYTALDVGQATFTGSGGSSVSATFSITAPSVDPQQETDAPDVFPGQGNTDPCFGTAFATIAPVEIQQVGDATGQPIDPVDIDLSSGLGLAIAGAFALTPGSNTFGIGGTVSVTVVVTDPHVIDADYGDYDVKLAAKAPGYGIGVGNGPHFLLRLRGATATDTTPPVVTVTKPSGDEVLGVIAVEVQAYDPSTPLPATGLASLSATVSSAGGAVSSAPVSLTLVPPTLPVGAGVTVTGTGSFTPRGGAPGAGPGTSDTEAFTSASPSGIGTYKINAQATDLAGNTGYGSKTFKVNYAVGFSKEFSPPSCKTGGGSACAGQFEFTVNRSNITSDGAFMYDHTVAVQLVRVSDGAVMATHTFGTGSILSQVQISATPVYQTHFKRGDLAAPPSSPDGYRAEVYFRDVDGNWMLQATSNLVTF